MKETQWLDEKEPYKAPEVTPEQFSAFEERMRKGEREERAEEEKRRLRERRGKWNKS